MRKRLKWCVAVFMAAALALAGCGQEKPAEKPEGTGTGSGTNGGVVSLTLWSGGGDFDMLERMIEKFKEKYAGEAQFEITLEGHSDSGIRDEILGDIHSTGDIFQFPDDQLNSLVAGGVLEPVPNRAEIEAANLSEACGAAMINGTLYAYPLTADNGYFMYYNKAYFSEEDVRTLDGMLEVAAKANKKITMPFDGGWYMYTFFGNTGLEFGINDDGVTNYCNWNSTEGDITGLDIARALQNIAAHPGFEHMDNGEFVEAAREGRVIAGVSGIWHSMEIEELWGDNYGAVKLPTYTCAGKQVQMSSFTGYKLVGVNYYSKNKEWALKLADWITNEENQTIRFQEKNLGPSNVKAAASEELQKVPAIRALVEQSQFGSLQRVGNNYWAPFGEFGARLLAGGMSDKELQELMDNLVTGITASTVN